VKFHQRSFTQFSNHLSFGIAASPKLNDFAFEPIGCFGAGGIEPRTNPGGCFTIAKNCLRELCSEIISQFSESY
jgi:hypothetical protein